MSSQCGARIEIGARRSSKRSPDCAQAKCRLRPAPPKPHLRLPGELPPSRSALPPSRSPLRRAKQGRRTGRSPTPDQVRGRLSPSSGEGKDCRRHSDFALDIRPHFSYKPRISLTERTAAGDPGWRSESGSRGRGLVTSAPGRLRVIRPSGITTGLRGNPLDWDRPDAGNT